MANGFDHLVGNLLAAFWVAIFYAIYRLIKYFLFSKKIQIDLDGEQMTLDDFSEHEICGYNFRLKKNGKTIELRSSSAISTNKLLRLMYKLRNNGIVLLYQINGNDTEDCVAYYFNGKVRLIKKNVTLTISNDNSSLEKDLPLLRGMIVLDERKEYIVSRDLGEYRIECIEKDKGTDYRYGKVYTKDGLKKTFDWAINEDVTPELLNSWGVKLDDKGIVIFNE